MPEPEEPQRVNIPQVPMGDKAVVNKEDLEKVVGNLPPKQSVINAKNLRNEEPPIPDDSTDKFSG